MQSSPSPFQGRVLRVLLILLSVDALFVALHLVLRALQVFDLVEGVPPSLSLFGDYGPSERFNHVKWLAVAGMLLLMFRRDRTPVHLVLGLMFLLVFADDALMLHERGSSALLRIWPSVPSFGLNPHTASELYVWAAMGSVVGPALLWALLRTDRGGWKTLRYVGIGFIGLVFSAVVIDASQEMFDWIANPSLRYWVRYALTVAECAGEAASASVIAAATVALLPVTTSRGLAGGLAAGQGTAPLSGLRETP
ncbi:hypothetical protein V8J36_18770 [Frigidibacter sp. MR17.14]|uniref:hypothetical protein n=1 Tax=Frigidibacter sp. MR17.14 TaxID=3126509 RepID=UPI003012AB19